MTIGLTVCILLAGVSASIKRARGVESSALETMDDVLVLETADDVLPGTEPASDVLSATKLADDVLSATEPAAGVVSAMSLAGDVLSALEPADMVRPLEPAEAVLLPLEALDDVMLLFGPTDDVLLPLDPTDDVLLPLDPTDGVLLPDDMRSPWRRVEAGTPPIGTFNRFFLKQEEHYALQELNGSAFKEQNN